MNDNTLYYAVEYSDESGNSAHLEFPGTSEGRNDAIAEFHDWVSIQQGTLNGYAGFPQDDLSMDFAGYFSETEAQYGYMSTHYDTDHGNSTVCFAAIVEAGPDDSEPWNSVADVPDAFWY